MRLQTPQAALRGKSVRVNGTTYPIDAHGCVSVEGDDAEKLKKCGWVDPEAVKAARPTSPRARIQPIIKPSLGSAKRFIAIVESDQELASRVMEAQGFQAVSAIAEELGLAFTLDHLKQAKAARERQGKPPESTTPQHSQLAQDPEAVKATDPTPPVDPEPEEVEAEPTEEKAADLDAMEIDYLRDMADALGVDKRLKKKASLIEAIKDKQEGSK